MNEEIKIPEDVKQKIEEKAVKHESATPHDGLGPAIFIDGAVFGYSIALSEIARLKGLIEKAHSRGWYDAIGREMKWTDTSFNKFKLQHNL